MLEVSDKGGKLEAFLSDLGLAGFHIYEKPKQVEFRTGHQLRPVQFSPWNRR